MVPYFKQVTYAELFFVNADGVQRSCKGSGDPKGV